MQNPHFIRFLVASFPYLQGLTAVPLGLALMTAAFWANSLHRRAEPFELLLISILVAGLLLMSWLISRQYSRAFGRTQLSKRDHRLEVTSSLLGGALALGAFWLDVSRKLPFSAIGLVFVLALLSTYVKVTWSVRGKYLLHYPVAALTLLLLSILPSLGLPRWWESFGFRSQLVSVVAAAGFLIGILGLWSHILLVRMLPPVAET